MSTLTSYSIVNPSGKTDECARFEISDLREAFTLDGVTAIGQKYTFSCWLKSDSDGIISIYGAEFATNVNWQKHTFTFTADQEDLVIDFAAAGTYYIYHPKLEIGTMVTDWTLAPEDAKELADKAAAAADAAQTTASSAESRVAIAESLIQQLSDAISMLVTDGKGGSLMTQTKDGWTFSMASTNDALFAVSNGLSDLQKETNDTAHTVAELEKNVNQLGKMASYVKIKTDGAQPCIELGTGDSDFKLLITNTDIRFMEGSNVPAYISNQSLHIKKAVIEEELQQGGFVWTVRSNGNMGIMWKGVSS